MVGLEKLQQKLKRALEPVEQALANLADFVRGEAERQAKPHAADKGTLGRAVKVSFSGAGVALSATVAPPRATMGLAYTIEEGRRPGKQPPSASIGRWAKAHGIATNAWVLVKLIKERGTKGIHFMAGAAEAGEKKAPELLRKAGVEIERRFSA